MKPKNNRAISFALALALVLAMVEPVNAYEMGMPNIHSVVSSSVYCTAVIKMDGSLWMWGYNRYGQLGDGTTEDHNIPTKVLDNVVAISCGWHTAAIRGDGSLWMWGYNKYGELGFAGGNKENDYGDSCQTTPVKMLDNVTAVSCGNWHTAAIRTDGSLWMWGLNRMGQLGDGTTEDHNTPVKALNDVAAVSCGAGHTAAIKADGSLWIWGNNIHGELGIGRGNRSETPVKVLDNVSAVSCGWDHTAAIKTDGSLWIWGNNEYGQLGDGTEESRRIPVKILDNVAAVGCGRYHTAAIKTDGSLWTWGFNRMGQLGDGTTEDHNTPVKVLDDAILVSCDYHTSAIRGDGSLWAWGDNYNGKLGDGTTEKRSTPIKIMEGVMTPNTVSIEPGYIYDTTDPSEDVVLHVTALDMVVDASSASVAVQTQTRSMTTEQKESAMGADLATLYAETAVAKAASETVTGGDILINKAAVTELEAIAKQTSEAVESALVSGGVSTARYINNAVTLKTEETGEISIRIDPDILDTEVDKIVVETPTYAITLKVDDLKEDLAQILTITAQDVGSGFGPGDNKKTTVKVNLPNGKTSNPVTLSLPKDSGDTTYQAVVSTSGTATSSKYNPATTTMDGKVSTSGSYTVKTNQKDFSDIANKSVEMQNAIRYLASKGIINGTDATHFSPDGSITRAEIAALMVRALGKLDNSAKPTFKDVTTSNWYYATAASSQKAGLINGYEDNTFRGGTQINKEQIVAVSARVLTNEMGYKAPSNPSSYLSKYSDSVVGWAQGDVALATRENLVVYRTDGTFSGSKGMTRGDAAIIIYRLFQRIW